MTVEARELSTEQVAQLRAVADVLLPGLGDLPSATRIPEYDELAASAVSALGREREALDAALDRLPPDPGEADVSTVAEAHPVDFELIAAVAVGAYFMSTSVLTGIGFPSGTRRAPSLDQAVDELSSGILDPVFERGSPVKHVS